MRRRLPADVLLLATVLCWSFNFTVVKYALTHGWEPLSYSSVRFAIGAVLFSAVTVGREGSLRVSRRLNHRPKSACKTVGSPNPNP